MANIEVTIKLKIKGKEIELTKDEVEKLRDVLDGILVRERTIEKEIIKEVPYYPYIKPIIWKYTGTDTEYFIDMSDKSLPNMISIL